MHFLIISIIYGINYWIFYTIYSVKYPIYYPLGVASRKDEILYKHEIQVNTKNTAGVKLGITVCVTYGQDIVDNQPCKGEIMCCCLANDNLGFRFHVFILNSQLLRLIIEKIVFLSLVIEFCKQKK
jgi:hypothetical protein